MGNVFAILLFTSFQTLERRWKIAEQNNHCNPQTWDTIRHIIDWLDVDGMSGDETDTPLGANPKIVRQVALPWISPTITGLLHAVESYAPATYKENMSIPVGNASLPRLVEAKRTSKNTVAIAWLPRNWYDDNWYKVNSSSARALLGVHKDFEVPFLVCSCVFTLQVMTHYVIGCLSFCKRCPSMKNVHYTIGLSARKCALLQTPPYSTLLPLCFPFCICLIYLLSRV